jgi:hypothetical protein
VTARAWFLDVLVIVWLDERHHTQSWEARSIPSPTFFAARADANAEALQRMRRHTSAAMTLDTRADLFDDDLGSVADRLDERILAESNSGLWSN